MQGQDGHEFVTTHLREERVSQGTKALAGGKEGDSSGLVIWFKGVC